MEVAFPSTTTISFSLYLKGVCGYGVYNQLIGMNFASNAENYGCLENNDP